MSSQITNKALNKLFEIVSSFVYKQIDEHKWEKMFVDTGELLIDRSNCDELGKDLRVAFSEENLSALASSLNSSSKYSLSDAFHDQLYKLMIRYEVPQEECEAYIHHFIEMALSWLEKEKPDEYERVYLGEWRRESEEQYQQIITAIKELGENVKALKDKDIKALTIDDVERGIIKRARYPMLDLSFFATDDVLFDKDFSNELKNNKESIYVVGDNKEEALYRICNRIKEEGQELNALIIEDEEEWLRLDETGISGKILIPNFISEEITVINKNINIFIYNRDIPVYREYLNLRRRTSNNLVKALERIGVENASIVFERTHGLFSSIKKILFKDASFSQPEWVKNPSRSVIAALLCGNWTECEGDKLVLEELSGFRYDDFLESILPYTRGEGPLIIQIEGHGRKSWQLASVNDAWEELDGHIQAEQWSRFVNILYEVLIVTDPLFDKVPFSEHYIQRIFMKNEDWSQPLRQGMLRSLIMRAYYKSHIENQRDVDHLVERILDTIDTMGKWGYISQYIGLLCEASPEVVLRRIEKEFTNPTGLFELFKENSGDMLTGANYYINILWTVEKLLQLKDYTHRALEWLWKLNEINIDYKASNSPADVLRRVFCAWYNCCQLTTDNKIKQAEKAIQTYESAWDIIASELPEKSGSSLFPLAALHYRQGDDIEQPIWDDTKRIYNVYLQLCVDNVKSCEDMASKRWITLLEALSSYDDEIKEKALGSLIEQSSTFSDSHICKIKNKIRDIVHRHRYFHDSDWSMPENAVQEFENTLFKLEQREPEYDYEYLFFYDYRFPTLHPIPYDKEDGHAVHSKNDKLRENEIRFGLNEFRDRELNVEKLIQIVLYDNDTTGCTLGEVLAKYYSNDKYDDNIFQFLLKYDLRGYQLYQYVRELLNVGEMDIFLTYNRAKELRANEDQLIHIISLQLIGNEEHILIYNENDEIKRRFWQSEGFFPISKDISLENVDKALNECFRFGTIGSYITLLYLLKDQLNNADLFSRFMKIEDVDLISRNAGGSYSYELKKLLSRLQEAYIDDQEKAQSVGRIELIFSELLDWEDMKCFQKEVRKDPALYAQMIDILFIKDNELEDGKPKDKNREKFISHTYRLYQKALFCPTEKNGKVTYDELKQWIEKFIELLDCQHQKSLWERRIGRLLSCSPIGKDGYMPCEAVRKIIEEYKSDEIRDAYVIAERNKRGVFVASAGAEEIAISERYKRNAEALSEDYPWTAQIYSKLSDVYMQDAISERERAVYE